PTTAPGSPARGARRAVTADLGRSLGLDLGHHGGHEGIDAHAPIGTLRTPGVHTNGGGVRVVVADHEDVGDLLHLPTPDPRPERLIGDVHGGAHTGFPTAVGHRLGIGVVVVTHGQDDHLDGQ